MEKLILTKTDLMLLVSKDIYDRGEEYYDNGLVSDIVQNGNVFEAEVYGTKTYQVRFEFSNSEMKNSCDCLYYGSGKCKHIVALGLAIIDECLVQTESSVLQEKEEKQSGNTAILSDSGKTKIEQKKKKSKDKPPFQFTDKITEEDRLRFLEDLFGEEEEAEG